MKLSVLLTFLYLFSRSCGVSTSIPCTYPDPYAESFYSKGLKFQIGVRSNEIAQDTIEFDQYGNIIRTRQYWSQQFFSYDSLRYPTRLLTINDAPSNYVVTYGREDNILLQYWFEVNHNKWEIDLVRDLNSKPDMVVQHELDRRGLIGESKDLMRNKRATYKYNEQKSLTEKHIYSMKNGELLAYWKYEYGDNHLISRIQVQEGGKTSFIHYFSTDGLLDSTVYKSEIVRYKYVYR
ncbi:MAG: hypothetical protein KF845_10715 [Cyclobacteriaceae bacterium]|nr:hypothetical protein [Cyclobacteriaceae bacterium]